MSNDKKQPHDEAVAAELAGFPEEFLDGGADGESIVDELGKLQAELSTAQQDILYAQAETQNVRRRFEKELADTRSYAVTGFAREVLSIADNLARALDAVPAELREDDKLKSLIAGIEATQREIDKIFTNHGISRIASVGLPLDPNQHQAMVEVPTADAAPGTVVQEMQAGYMLRDRLLRPAMVVVAKKPD
jgi:molecular chaperone GrpE